jgi:RNA polymerase sigma-70 factor, ECF subfamily
MLRTEKHAIRTLNPDLTKPYALEADLIRRAVAGQSEAFCELVRPCERAVFMSAFAILQNQEDAEDAAQEAVFKAFATLSKFRGESKFSTWLCRIVINESLMRLRKGRRQLQESLDEPYQNENGDSVLRDFADWRPIPSKELENEELRKMLSRALASLRPKYRSVLILRDVQQFSIAEAAALLGVKPCAVKARLFRARLQMRDRLAALGNIRSIGSNGCMQIQAVTGQRDLEYRVNAG